MTGRIYQKLRNSSRGIGDEISQRQSDQKRTTCGMHLEPGSAVFPITERVSESQRREYKLK
jgi:hypothetical protein